MGHDDDYAAADGQVTLMNWTGYSLGPGGWSSFTVRFPSRSRRHAGDLAVYGNQKCLGRAFTVSDRPIAALCRGKRSPAFQVPVGQRKLHDASSIRPARKTLGTEPGGRQEPATHLQLGV